MKMKKILRIPYLMSVREKNKNKNFTLISQNCLGGAIYHNLGIEFMSPTINLFIEGLNFVKLVENLEYYMNVYPKELCEEYVDPIDCNIKYPKIIIDDIEVCCLHYKNCKEAIDAWNRRRKRVNLNNVYVLANTWNMNNDLSLVKRLLRNSKYKTVVFSTKECFCEGTILLSDKIWQLDNRGIARPNITDYSSDGYRKYFEVLFDYVGWLNN